jgi:putative endonuclease
MTIERRRLGADGERAAERALRQRGYTILERNYRCPIGEVDLVALHRGAVVFVEVKTVRRTLFGGPDEAVGRRKQRQIARVAEHYLAARRLYERDVRFDVVGVCLEGDELVCSVLQDAFDPDWSDDW